MTTVRVLDPLSGDVIDVDPSAVPFIEELEARLGGSPQTASAVPADRTHPDTHPGSLHSASYKLIHADTAEPASTRPVPAPRRQPDMIVPWSAQTCERVRDGLPARYQALVDTGQGLGLRFGELAALAVEDLDRGNVLVRRQVKRVGGCLVWALPKGGKQRVLPLDKGLAVIFRAHQARFTPVPVSLPWDTQDGRRETYQILFATISGGPLDRAYALRMWRTAVSGAGLTPSRVTGTHQLRHHFASELIAKGTDLETVRRLLGHADLLTTQRYIHSLAISDKQARAAVAKVTPRPRPAPALPAGVADFSAYKTRRTAP